MIYGVAELGNIDMAAQDDSRLSPTVTKVLDEYLATLIADEDIDNDAAKRLNGLLRQGKVPKFEDIQAALYSSQKEDK